MIINNSISLFMAFIKSLVALGMYTKNNRLHMLKMKTEQQKALTIGYDDKVTYSTLNVKTKRSSMMKALKRWNIPYRCNNVIKLTSTDIKGGRVIVIVLAHLKSIIHDGQMLARIET